MADRMFERAFNRAAAASVGDQAEQPLRPRQQAIKAEAGATSTAATPMQVSDAIQRVLLADQDNDYFRYIPQVCPLQVPQHYLLGSSGHKLTL